MVVLISNYELGRFLWCESALERGLNAPFSRIAIGESFQRAYRPVLNLLERLMRRLTISLRKWFAARARNEAKKKSVVRRRSSSRTRKLIVQAWSGAGVEDVFVKRQPWRPPAVLCFDHNTEDTLKFFEDWRLKSAAVKSSVSPKRLSWLTEPRNGRGMKSIETYADYAGIETISTAAAVVIAADYERLAALVGSAPPTINLHLWSDPVFKKLFELGFFEIVGLTERVSDRYHDNGKARTMQILSGTNAEGNKVASEHLLALSALITEGRGLSDEVSFALNSALDEAMINVARHAYPEDHNTGYRHIGKWWVTAEADRLAKTLTIVIYDQGATIPFTLPRRKAFHAVVDSITRLVSPGSTHEFDNDSAYIAAAMDLGTSQTGQPFRGYGIPQMKDLIDICGKGRLSIFSRGGRCEYEARSNWGIRRSSFSRSIGGTLIEWVIELPENPNANSQ
ncbi:MAG: ATP-binding protein [Cypionkella sp.]|uniref:ATP-binding protein n=1 Tax=Cypionkella sp. TaxID=2811411 RepID=UPI002731A2CE|nr:ATP-binding protein [Cypionkella sp.]MDP2051937.1 ATP-binding protein [Cypionkella sp.]